MHDDQVDTEELAESRRQREAEPKATDDVKPLAPGNEKPIAEGAQRQEPKKWIRYARKWFGTGSGFMRP
jgi:hypothetical protein